MTLQSQNFSLSNLQIFSFMTDVFTPKRIYPDSPFKTTQRLAKISILTPWCAVWLPGAMHTTEIDSDVGCTPQSLTPRYEAHRGVFWESWCPWLRSVMHNAELDSAVGSTPRSQTSSNSVFMFSNSLRLSTTFYRKTSEVKTISWTICDL